MISTTHVRADVKQIVREPVLVLFMVIPLFIYIVFKLVIVFGFPLVWEYFKLDISEYRVYILAFVLMMSPGMLGTVVGFLMIDDRDEKIYELMSVTPLGPFGYIINRLYIPLLGGIIYTFIGYYILNVYYLNFFALLYLSLMAGVQGILIGLLLFTLARDKVQGLTFSKGFGVFYIIALADLLNIRWVSIAAGFLPFYWITKIILNTEAVNVLVSAVVHIVWLTGILYKYKRDK